MNACQTVNRIAKCCGVCGGSPLRADIRRCEQSSSFLWFRGRKTKRNRPRRVERREVGGDKGARKASRSVGRMARQELSAKSRAWSYNPASVSRQTPKAHPEGAAEVLRGPRAERSRPVHRGKRLRGLRKGRRRAREGVTLAEPRAPALEVPPREWRMNHQIRGRIWAVTRERALGKRIVPFVSRWGFEKPRLKGPRWQYDDSARTSLLFAKATWRRFQAEWQKCREQAGRMGQASEYLDTFEDWVRSWNPDDQSGFLDLVLEAGFITPISGRETLAGVYIPWQPGPSVPPPSRIRPGRPSRWVSGVPPRDPSADERETYQPRYASAIAEWARRGGRLGQPDYGRLGDT